jgi:hypothetical protein
MQKEDMKKKGMNKKGGVVSDLISGTGGLVILVIVILLITSTLIGAGLLTSGSNEDNAVKNLSANFTSGIGKVAEKIPTILLVGAVVLLFGAILLLVKYAQSMGIMGRSGGGL